MTQNTNEEWRSIRFVRGRRVSDTYEVSTHGRVRRRILDSDESKPEYVYHNGYVGPRGYVSYSLRTEDNRSIRVDAHALVWDAFGVGSRVGHHIHHIDENPQNNRIENLARLTPREHRQAHSSLSVKDVRAIRRRIADGTPASRVALDYPVTDRMILYIASGERWSKTG